MYQDTSSIPRNLLIAILACLKAGTHVLKAYNQKLLSQNDEDQKKGSAFSFWTKGTQQIVTPTDIASNEIIQKTIHEHCEAHCILSEEGRQLIRKNNFASVWIIDPLDGTTNFAQQIPYFVIAISLTSLEGDPVLTAVYHPITTELFTAYKNEGCYLHLISTIPQFNIDNLTIDNLASSLVFPHSYKKLRTSQLTAPNKDSIIDTGSALPHSDYIERINRITQIPDVENLRDYSSAIYTACKIASGNSIMASMVTDVHLWDIVPSILMVQEANGAINDILGQDNGLAAYTKKTLSQYLSTTNEEEFKAAVEQDQGKMIIAASQGLLENFIAPALNPVAKPTYS